MSMLRLTASLFELTSLMHAQARPILRGFDLSFTQFQTLSILLTGEPITQHQLAQYLVVSDPAVSRMLTGIQDAGLVEVRINPAHLRQRLVSLTDAGRELAGEVAAALERHFQERTRAADVDPTALTAQLDLLRRAMRAS